MRLLESMAESVLAEQVVARAQEKKTKLTEAVFVIMDIISHPGFIPPLLRMNLFQRTVRVLNDQAWTERMHLDNGRIESIDHPDCAYLPIQIVVRNDEEWGMFVDNWLCETCNTPIYKMKRIEPREDGKDNKVKVNPKRGKKKVKTENKETQTDETEYNETEYNETENNEAENNETENNEAQNITTENGKND